MCSLLRDSSWLRQPRRLLDLRCPALFLRLAVRESLRAVFRAFLAPARPRRGLALDRLAARLGRPLALVALGSALGLVLDLPLGIALGASSKRPMAAVTSSMGAMPSTALSSTLAA